jgi:TolB-like protein/predicted Ser/Thr protein kinase
MIEGQIAHYRIREKLGEGGMGVVYKAEDTKLKRFVALKFLPAETARDYESRERFLREAQAAAVLDHPNICTVYEVNETDGKAYIAMAYIDGETLAERISRGPLLLTEALDIAAKVSAGLAAAHQRGIVHRDIKSSNIMITAGGEPKIMDFGLAKTAHGSKLTRTGTTLGTTAYMSPEQVLGREADTRSDVWSLGVVLYEMLTGLQPFRGEYDPAVLYAIANERPSPLTDLRPDIPLEIEQLVERALEKDPEKRFQDAGEILAEIHSLRESLDLLTRRGALQRMLIRRRRRLTIGAAALIVIAAGIIGARYIIPPAQARTTVAVLPCRNLGIPDDMGWVPDAVTGDIISRLSNIGAVRVTNQLSVERYRGTDLGPSEIAAQLGVTYLIHQSLRMDGGKVYLSVQLIDSESDAVVWAHEYTYGLEDAERTAVDIALAAAQALGIRLEESEENLMANIRTVDPAAYRAFQEAHRAWAHREEPKRVLSLYEEALRIDPDFALGWAEYALVQTAYNKPGPALGRQSYADQIATHHALLEDAREMVDKAFALDPDLPEAWAARGVILRYIDEGRAEEAFVRAIELKPSYMWSYYFYSTLLYAQGRYKEAIDQAKKAVELEPQIAATWTRLGVHFRDARRYEEAERSLLRALEIEEWIQTFYEIAALYIITHRYEEAQDYLVRYFSLQGLDTFVVGPMVSAIKREISPEPLLPVVEMIEERFGPHLSAGAYAQFGLAGKAVEALERTRLLLGKQQCERTMDSPLLDPIRDEPQFIDFKKRIEQTDRSASDLMPVNKEGTAV